jgi:dihydroorotate dehydrogenase
MSWLYRRCVRPLLFQQDAEAAHERTLGMLARVSLHQGLCGTMQRCFSAPKISISRFGLTFSNPVGVAAGLDKNAAALPAWQALGFGFTEIGAVTQHPQPGNERPRLFRIVPHQAIINRMGFNNAGSQAMAEKLASWKQKSLWPLQPHPVGVNLGKSKITPLENAAEDYAASVKLLQPFADFFVINVSSPNTPNLRQLQGVHHLREILRGVQSIQQNSQLPPRPVLIKIAPDLALEDLDAILALCLETKVAGIVATNTTISRPAQSDGRLESLYREAGGLSGRPLKEKSTQLIRHIHSSTRGRLPIIGVGGISSATDAWEKIAAGACLVQIYTGLVYEGPGLAKSVVCGLQEIMQKQGLKTLDQAVGVAS